MAAFLSLAFPGLSLLIYQLSVYPRTNKILGPIKTSRVAAVSKKNKKINSKCSTADTLSCGCMSWAVPDLAGSVHAYSLRLPLHDTSIRNCTVRRSKHCVDLENQSCCEYIFFFFSLFSDRLYSVYMYITWRSVYVWFMLFSLPSSRAASSFRTMPWYVKDESKTSNL